MDRTKVATGLNICTSSEPCNGCPYLNERNCSLAMVKDALELLKEQDKKQITVHKRHVITLRRNDIFSMRNLYESICETLMDEGSLIIVRKDDHEKVDFEWEIVDNSET